MARILIIDDDSAVREYLATLVRRLNHEAVTAGTCAEGMAKMADSTLQIIIADINLPDSVNLDAWISRLRTGAEGRPLILITGEPTEELAAKAQGAGITAFLAKPFELAFIKRLLAEALEPHHAQVAQ
jgi:DNA-binding NtrC family response regulator